MNNNELIAFFESETTTTATVLINTLIEYFRDTANPRLANAIYDLASRSSLGNVSLVNSKVVTDVKGRSHNPSNIQDRTKRG